MNVLEKLAIQLRRGLNEVNDYNYIAFKEPGNTIPLVVHQSYSQKTLPHMLQENREKMKLMNPDWEFKLYDDDDIDLYIDTHYPGLMKIYKRINPKYGAARVDFFRYLLIYNEGGVYLDIKSSMTRPLNEIIKKDDRYLLSHWPNNAGDAYENSGIYVDLPNIFGEFQQWHIISIKGHPFLKSVIENVCNNIMNYNPFLHHTGETGIFRVTGPVAYTLAILPLLNHCHHTLVRSNNDLSLVYSIFGNNKEYKHRAIFKNHYSKINESIVSLNLLFGFIFKIYQPIKDRLLLNLRKLRH